MRLLIGLIRSKNLSLRLCSCSVAMGEGNKYGKFQRIPYLFSSHHDMATGTEQEQPFRLICLLEGDDNLFVITLPVTAIVDQLRSGVHQMGQLDASNVRVVAVTLWKVCPEFHIIIDYRT
jgi:hypothetical protein